MEKWLEWNSSIFLTIIFLIFFINQIHLNTAEGIPKGASLINMLKWHKTWVFRNNKGFFKASLVLEEALLVLFIPSKRIHFKQLMYKLFSRFIWEFFLLKTIVEIYCSTIVMTLQQQVYSSKTRLSRTWNGFVAIRSAYTWRRTRANQIASSWSFNCSDCKEKSNIHGNSRISNFFKQTTHEELNFLQRITIYLQRKRTAV